MWDMSSFLSMIYTGSEGLECLLEEYSSSHTRPLQQQWQANAHDFNPLFGSSEKTYLSGLPWKSGPYSWCHASLESSISLPSILYLSLSTTLKRWTGFPSPAYNLAHLSFRVGSQDQFLLVFLCPIEIFFCKEIWADEEGSVNREGHERGWTDRKQ